MRVISCASCNSTQNVPDTFRGSHGCQKCGAIIQVPALPQAISEASASETNAAKTAAPSYANRQQRSHAYLDRPQRPSLYPALFLVLGAVGLCSVVGVGAHYFFSAGRPSAGQPETGNEFADPLTTKDVVAKKGKPLSDTTSGSDTRVRFGPRGIKDDGAFFTSNAISKANDTIKDIHQDFNKDLLIETYETVPGDQIDEFKKVETNEAARAAFFERWARQRGRAAQVNGVIILITRKPRHLEIAVGTETQRKEFTNRNRDELIEEMLGKLREGKDKDDATKREIYDAVLLQAVQFVHSTMKANVRDNREKGVRRRFAPGPGAAEGGKQRQKTDHAGTRSAPWQSHGWLCFASVESGRPLRSG
jgi:transcription initiation factor TFIIIB Brf1 subunit/transcription initiation factor TFIIB